MCKYDLGTACLELFLALLGTMWLTVADLCSHPQIEFPAHKDAGLPLRESAAQDSPTWGLAWVSSPSHAAGRGYDSFPHVSGH